MWQSIGDKIREFEETGDHIFLFGCEESYGYLGATFVRDKDAVMAALLGADAVAFYKARGRTLSDALEELWQLYGYFLEDLHNVTLPGQEGRARWLLTLIWCGVIFGLTASGIFTGPSTRRAI